LLSKKVWLEKIPFFLIALIFGLAVMYAQKETGYIKPLNGATVSFANRLLLGSFGFVMYLFNWLAPYNLSAYYPYPFDALKPAPAIFWMSVLIIPAVGFLMFYLPRRSKNLTFALWFFVLNIFVMLRFLQANPGDFYIADRYLYIASFAMVFAFALLVQKIMGLKKPAPMIKILLVFLLILSGTLTVYRVMIWKDSKTLLNDILIKHPNAYTALNCRGDLLLEEGNLVAALKDFDKAVSLNANNDRAFANRGRARALSGNIEGALQDLDRAVALNPKDPANYVNRGIARDISGDFTSALSDLNHAIKLSPGFTDAWVNRGNVYVHCREYSLALADYNKALKLVPDMASAYAGRGTAKSNMNDFKGALTDFNQAEHLGYTQSELYYQRGLNYYKMQQFKEALSDFTLATKKFADHGMAWAYMGFANYNLGNYQQAINDLDNATRLNPGFDLAYAMRGMAYLRMGSPQYGCADLHLAANLGNKAAAAEMERSCK
jgi:tetratricopeptide (TPR) repeat protein